MGPDKALHVGEKNDPGCLPLLAPKGTLYSVSFYHDFAKTWQDRDKLFTKQNADELTKAFPDLKDRLQKEEADWALRSVAAAIAEAEPLLAKEPAQALRKLRQAERELGKVLTIGGLALPRLREAQGKAAQQEANRLAAVLGLLLLLAWSLRRAGVIRPAVGAGRLAITGSLPLDSRNRLFLVRCDGREHLLALGPAGVRVIESQAAIPAPIPPPQEGS